MKKNQLNYSELTDTVYWVDGKGQKHDVTQNFIQMMLCWMTNASLPKVGAKRQRVLEVNGVTHWELEARRKAE